MKPEITFKNIENFKQGDTIEIQPQSLVIMNSIAELITKINGAALIIDYGEN